MATQAENFLSTNPSAWLDPIVGAARQIAALECRYNDLDGKPAATGSENTYRTDERENITDRIEILKAFISTQEARSLTAVMIQLLMIHNLCDQNLTLGATDEQVKEDGTHYRRLYYSVLCFLGAAVPDDARLLLKELGSSHCDPWIPYEERLAAIAAKNQ